MAKKKRRSKKEMAALRSAEGTPPNPAPPSGEFVGKQEFNEFKESQEKTMGDILKGIEALAKPAEETRRVMTTGSQPEASVATAKPSDASAERSNYTLNPAHQQIVEEYFDPADGFEFRLDYPYFTIIVPNKFSNADPAWKKYYKTDTRMKFLKHDNIEGGMRDWCKLVASNLHYKKGIQTK